MSFPRSVLFAGLAVAAAATTMIDNPLASPRLSGASPGIEGLRNAGDWVNSPPLSREDLQGKVVLVEFWTYTCINWLRTMPYVREWSKKYEDDGLVVIGVHSPEFSFEHDPSNVRSAIKDLGIDYPVAIDNGFSVWRAFHNDAWPALYVLDTEGRVRHRQAGEGRYEDTERVIQNLLAESGRTNVSRDLVTPKAFSGAEVQADWSSLRAPETYLGAERATRFASPGGVRAGRSANYALPSSLRENTWGLSGRWTMEREATALDQANGRLAYRFHARDVHLVMGSASAKPVRFRVLIDGKPPGNAHGTDIDAAGFGSAGTKRLYQLVRQPAVNGTRTVEVEFLDAGAAVYALTFG